ncbi:PQQ-dependent sugar dehydrogenase [Chitinophaga lutea]
MKKLLLIVAVLSICGCYGTRRSKGGGQVPPSATTRNVNPDDIAVPEGYTVSVVASGLNFPTAIAFDDGGIPYVTESGYSYGEVFTTPKLLKLTGGKTEVIASGKENGPWTGIWWHEGNFYVAEGGQRDGGKILKVSPSGTIATLAEGLPGQGDHHTNGPVVWKGEIYFGTGTVTNSGVVGKDNAAFGWLTRHPSLHDLPCEDIVLNGVNFKTEDNAETGAYRPFGTASVPGEKIKGVIPCTGAILKIPLKGGTPQLVAWGLRNPYGLGISPQGRLYVTENGADDRGSRPLWGTPDVMWEISEGAWYGWPDFVAGLPVALFKPPGSATPQPLLQRQPGEVPKPVAKFAVHSSSNGFDFSTNERFGFKDMAFVAQFGDMAPGVGKVLKPVGFKVVWTDVRSGEVKDFAVNKGRQNGPASRVRRGGLERPVSVKFDPAGENLYIVDFGILRLKPDGSSEPVQHTGVIWKIAKNSDR